MSDGSPDAEAILYSEDLVDALAAIEHARWAHWQNYVHDQCEQHADGSLRIPADLVKRWKRQIETPYSELTEDEKNSDRQQVLRYLPTIAKALP